MDPHTILILMENAKQLEVGFDREIRFTFFLLSSSHTHKLIFLNQQRIPLTQIGHHFLEFSFSITVNYQLDFEYK